ncbi:MAG: SpoIID/LytB domain-containing protein [Flavobacteriales bacterium]|jgi:stage II sporulation protein D|nr:SpoIID/LytB domain-containing protein [Flavobacteriales bacterium]
MKFLTVIIILFLFVSNSYAEEVLAVGIYRNITIKRAVFSHEGFDYQLVADDTIPVQLVSETDKIVISRLGDQVKIAQNDIAIGVYNKISFYRTHPKGYFRIQTMSPSTKRRIYYGNLEVKVINGIFTFINHVPLEQYLIGVLESESGNYQSKEYYKVQAIISRTYALKHKNKFLHEGFMLTDLVNCQVYFGKFYQNPKMEEAIAETKGLVLVDSEMKYITAAFYSNSGGQTENSENVWNKPVSYLRSKKDPFSVGKNNYRWSKTINKKKWLSYLKEKYEYPIEDSIAREKVTHFNQKNRKKYLAGWESHILLTDIRKDWRLKSTYFSILDQGENIVLKGHGFGHGVGLSQEGAMNMVDLGYSYTDVLHFYYTNVYLIDDDRRLYYLLD